MTTQKPLLVQIPNVGIPSTIQWRFYNAKRFAVIPEWQMEKKLQFISDRITGWLSKRSIKNKWKLFTGYFVVTAIWKSNILWKFCFSAKWVHKYEHKWGLSGHIAWQNTAFIRCLSDIRTLISTQWKQSRLTCKYSMFWLYVCTTIRFGVQL